MVRVLSQQHHSWYGEAALFLRMLRQFAPQSLDRVFGQIDITKAEIGWAASLARGGGPRRSAALLVEFAQRRIDALGDIARRLRGRFPKLSMPKPRISCRSSEVRGPTPTWCTTTRSAGVNGFLRRRLPG